MGNFFYKNEIIHFDIEKTINKNICISNKHSKNVKLTIYLNKKSMFFDCSSELEILLLNISKRWILIYFEFLCCPFQQCICV